MGGHEVRDREPWIRGRCAAALPAHVRDPSSPRPRDHRRVACRGCTPSTGQDASSHATSSTSARSSTAAPMRRRLCRAASFAILTRWQSLLDALPAEQELPSFPIWAMEFGATYPYADRNPAGLGFECTSFKGAFGQSLKGFSPERLRDLLPSYARSAGPSFPEWKKTFVRQNRRFYAENQGRPSTAGFHRSGSSRLASRKLEWNWKGGRARPVADPHPVPGVWHSCQASQRFPVPSRPDHEPGARDPLGAKVHGPSASAAASKAWTTCPNCQRQGALLTGLLGTQ